MADAGRAQKAIVPVGGLGTRLLPLTKVLPKELLPIGRRPIIQYVVEEMRAAGFENICLITGRKKTLIQEHFDHDPELIRHLQDLGRDEILAELAYLESGLNLTYIRQSGPQGLADAIGLAEDYVDEQPFVVALGDSIILEPEPGSLLRRMVAVQQETGAAVTIAVEAVGSDETRGHTMVCPSPVGAVSGDAFAVADLTDKPQLNGGNTQWVAAARFVFNSAVFAAIRNTRPARGGQTNLMDTIRLLLASGAKVQAVCLTPEQQGRNMGSVEGYFRTFVEFALRDPECGGAVRSALRRVLRNELATD